MQKTKVEKIAKSVEQAIEEALIELNATREQVTIEVLEKGGKGFLGLGNKEAKVIVELKEDEEIEIYQGENGDEDVTEDVEECANVAIAFLKNIFTNMDLTVQFEVELYDNEVKISITGENVGLAIGRHGETLDAIQYLTNLATRRAVESYVKVNIDIESYRKKREKTLSKLAEKMANNVIRNGQSVTLEPMNAYERRIIHATLQDNELVTTHSVGEEPFNRKVVIESISE